MKPPTKKELQELAVRALGDGATVEIERQSNRFLGNAASEDSADMVTTWRDSEALVRLVLGMRLRALAEVKHGD